MQGEFTVVIRQDPRRILIPEHAEFEMKTKAAEELGMIAVEKATISQENSPWDHMLETNVSVVIMSLEEMKTKERYIKWLENQVKMLNELRGGGPYG